MIKIFKILFVDYIKKIYNLILNTNKKKKYGLSIYDYLTIHPNRNISKFIKYLNENNSINILRNNLYINTTTRSQIKTQNLNIYDEYNIFNKGLYKNIYINIIHNFLSTQEYSDIKLKNYIKNELNDIKLFNNFIMYIKNNNLTKELQNTIENDYKKILNIKKDVSLVNSKIIYNNKNKIFDNKIEYFNIYIKILKKYIDKYKFQSSYNPKNYITYILDTYPEGYNFINHINTINIKTILINNTISSNKLSSDINNTNIDKLTKTELNLSKEEYLEIYKDILKKFIKKYPKTEKNKDQYKNMLKEYIDYTINYNTNNIDEFLKYPKNIILKDNKIIINIDYKFSKKTYIHKNLDEIIKKINKYSFTKIFNNNNIFIDKKLEGYIKLILFILIIDIIKDEYNIKNNINLINTDDINDLFSMNFTDNQEVIYDTIINNMFTNYNNIDYKLSTNKEFKIKLYIYKSNKEFINIIIVLIYYIFNVSFKQNKFKIINNIIEILKFSKTKLIDSLNLYKYELNNCGLIKKNIIIQTFCANNYKTPFNKNINSFKEISKILQDIINNNNFKISYSKSKDKFKFIILKNKLKKTKDEYLGLTKQQFLQAINKDINTFINKKTHENIINIICKFIEEITNIFLDIITNNKLIFHILNIDTTNVNGLHIYNIYNNSKYINNIKILCIIMFIKFFIKYLVNFFNTRNSFEEVFDDIIENINNILLYNIDIIITYDIQKILNDFINKNTFIISK